MIKVMGEQLLFKIKKLPKFTTNLVIVGDLIREIVAYETAFKLAETAYLPVGALDLKSFGMDIISH